MQPSIKIDTPKYQIVNGKKLSRFLDSNNIKCKRLGKRKGDTIFNTIGTYVQKNQTAWEATIPTRIKRKLYFKHLTDTPLTIGDVEFFIISEDLCQRKK
jgi:hypothetical protein